MGCEIALSLSVTYVLKENIPFLPSPPGLTHLWFTMERGWDCRFLKVSASVSSLSKRCEIVLSLSVTCFPKEDIPFSVLSVWSHICDLEWKEGGTTF